MTRKQFNIVDMTGVVTAYLNKPENQSIWQSNQAITDTVNVITANLTVIDALDKKQKAPVSGPAADKAMTRHDYEDVILHLAGQVGALAAKTNNATLEAQADLTVSQLDYMSVQDLVATAGRIGDLVTANLPALAAYNITAADVTTMAGLTTQFQAVATKPREAVVDRKKETDQVQPVVSSTMSTLRRQLDRQMLAFKRTNPEFYAGYLSARVIVDRGNPKKKKTAAPAAKPQ